MKLGQLFKFAGVAVGLMLSAQSQADIGWIKTTIQAVHTMGNGDVLFKIGPLREGFNVTCTRKSDFMLLRSDVNFEQNLSFLLAAQVAKTNVQILDQGNCSTIPDLNVGIVTQVMMGDF